MRALTSKTVTVVGIKGGMLSYSANLVLRNQIKFLADHDHLLS